MSEGYRDSPVKGSIGAAMGLLDRAEFLLNEAYASHCKKAFEAAGFGENKGV